jgi:hypothetical protein
VQVQAVLAGDQAQGLLDIGPQLIGGPSFAGIGAGGHDAAAAESFGTLESADVVALPAMQRNRDPAEPVHRLFRIHAQRGIPLIRQLVRLLNLS